MLMSIGCLSLSDFDRGWLVGFIEAEGSFTRKSDNYRPFFSLGQNDRDVLKEIQRLLGFGAVSKSWKKNKESKAWRYTVYAKSGLEVIIRFLNGRLKTELKKSQFRHWIDLFNSNIRKREFDYTFCGGDYVISTSQFDVGWLVGFVEGEGSFTYNKGDGWPVFAITHNDKRILEEVRRFFGFGQVIRHCGRIDCRAWRFQVQHNPFALDKLKLFFDGKLKSPSRQMQFNFWAGLFDPSHPIRVNGREHERLRSQEYYSRNPEKRKESVRRSRMKRRVLRVEEVEASEGY